MHIDNWRSEWKPLALISGLFLVFFHLPVGAPRFDGAILEALQLARWYAREHVLLCLVPAFFIAGAIAAFVSQASVMKYLGAGAKKILAYGVASVSGTILAVCSCTVLPLFAGIYRMGAGLGPAVAFLYAGPAVNALAIILTARILGLELGIARAVGAVVFSVVIGLVMHLIYRREEAERVQAQAGLPEPDVARPLWQTALYFAAMVAVLVFANWGKPQEAGGLWESIYSAKWAITGMSAALLGLILATWFRLPWGRLVAVAVIVAVLAWLAPHEPLLAFSAGTVGLALIIAPREDEAGEWWQRSWGFAKQILPLLLGGPGGGPAPRPPRARGPHPGPVAAQHAGHSQCHPPLSSAP